MPEKKNKEGVIGYNDYKIIRDSIKDAENAYNSIKDGLRKTIVQKFGLKHDIMETILQYSKEDLETKDIEELRQFLTTYAITEGKEFSDDEVRSILKEIKVMSDTVWTAKVELDNLKKDATEIVKEFMNYGTSDKEKNRVKTTIEALKTAEELEVDLASKRDLQKRIFILENCLSLDFVTERLKDLGKKEIDSINEGFFKFNRGSYVIDRFKQKIKKIGFEESLYYNYFNLEEIFLPEEYHVFNNLFLFIYMRMVAYADVYDERDTAWMKYLTGNFSCLFYHKFKEEEEEKHFLEVVMKALDYFKDYREAYLNGNTTAPGNPTRVKMEKERVAKEREVLIKKLEEYNITDYNPEASNKELREYLLKKIDTMVEEQYPTKEDDGKVTVTEEKDGSTSIKPVMMTVTEKRNPLNEDATYLVGISIYEKDNNGLAVNVEFFNTDKKRFDESYSKTFVCMKDIIKYMKDTLNTYKSSVFVIERNGFGLNLIDNIIYKHMSDEYSDDLKKAIYYNKGRLGFEAGDAENEKLKFFGANYSKSLKNLILMNIPESISKMVKELIEGLDEWFVSIIIEILHVYYFGNNLSEFNIEKPENDIEKENEEAIAHPQESEQPIIEHAADYEDNGEYDCDREEEDNSDDEQYE